MSSDERPTVRTGEGLCRTESSTRYCTSKYLYCFVYSCRLFCLQYSRVITSVRDGHCIGRPASQARLTANFRFNASISTISRPSKVVLANRKSGVGPLISMGVCSDISTGLFLLGSTAGRDGGRKTTPPLSFTVTASYLRSTEDSSC